jgi:cell division cycle protein 37
VKLSAIVALLIFSKGAAVQCQLVLFSNIDYSKWDNIELSDDEDFECHPNVDKKSMVRWKQAQVHKERRERQDQKDLLKLELSQTKIFIDFLPQQLERFKGLNNAQILIKLEELAKEVNDKFTEPMRKDSLQRMENWPGNWEPPVWGDVLRNHVPWNEELQNIGKALETKLLEKDLFSILSLEFKKTVEKFTARSKIVEQEIKNVEKIISQKLTMDSLVTGFDKTFVNEQKSSATLADEPVEKQKASAIETIHTPKLLSHQHQLEVFEEMESTDSDLVRLNKNLLNLSKLSDYGKIASLLKQDPTLLNEKIEEILLLRALCLEIISQPKEAKNAVMVSMIIKFIRNLGIKGIDVFFQRY